MTAHPWHRLGVFVVAATPIASISNAQTEWMQPGVRIWYMGGVGDWDMSSNAEEAYLIQSIAGTTATVRYHSAFTHWTAPRPPQTGTADLAGMGPCWIHPQRLRTLQEGDYWRADQRITLVQRLTMTYDSFSAETQGRRLLPVKALFDLSPQRQVVKLTYTIDPLASLPTGNALIDAETGLVLYHDSRWGGTKLFFMLAEINYDFARRVAFPEDRGPHTGFRSFVRESSQGYPLLVGGGSVVIQSLVESRHGAVVQMLVLPSIVPSTFSTAFRQFAFYGDVPITRQMQFPQSMNYPPDQWQPFGQHLWWWLPRTVTGALTSVPATPPASPVLAAAAALPAINVFNVPMTKTSDSPLTYTATQTPSSFHFTMLKFNAEGYLVEFAARDPSTGLHVRPGDINYWNCKGQVPPGEPLAACVDGLDYFLNEMALPTIPAPTIASIFPASGPVFGGTLISIKGTGFVPGATSVTIGGALATNVLVLGPNSLTCVTPRGLDGPREVHVIVSTIRSVASGTFVYVNAVTVAPPADPSQPVSVTVDVPGGRMSATFQDVTAVGSLSVVPIPPPAPPMPGIVFLPDTSLFIDVSGLAYTTARFCFPYDQAAVARAGLTEEPLMLWHQPPGSSTWVDATSSHDPALNLVCARDSVSHVIIAGASGVQLPHSRYLSEGATSHLFETVIALMNPSPSMMANAMLTFQRADTSSRIRYVAVPPRGRRTVIVKAVPEMAVAEFSTMIESDQPLVVDRTMRWDAAGFGGHAETSVAAPALVWYLAEGATHGGFDLFYLLQNPNPTAAEVHVRYLRPTDAPLEKTYILPPTSRTNIWVDYEEFPANSGNRALANTDVSAVFEVRNGQPIIVERAMYAEVPGQFFGAGHESAGITAPATHWFLAEGATGPFFDLFVLIANPTETAADVEVTYLLPDGTTIVKAHTVAPTSRFNIWVDYEYGDPRLAHTAVSTTVRSVNGVPIIVERAMWWPDGGWYEAHNSAGATVTGTRWALAEGEVDPARNLETYILIANTSATPAEVRVTLLFEDGTTAQRTFTGADIPPRSRFNVPVDYYFPGAAGKRFGALVESLGTAPAAIVVERAMYWDAAGQFWAAGTNALATRLP